MLKREKHIPKKVVLCGSQPLGHCERTADHFNPGDRLNDCRAIERDRSYLQPIV
ncbi:hypothetical protein D3C81_2267260 [compost metagenome]